MPGCLLMKLSLILLALKYTQRIYTKDISKLCRLALSLLCTDVASPWTCDGFFCPVSQVAEIRSLNHQAWPCVSACVLDRELAIWSITHSEWKWASGNNLDMYLTALLCIKLRGRETPCLCVHAGMCANRGQRLTSTIILYLFFFFFEIVSHWAWNSDIWLDWLAGEPQCSGCLCPQSHYTRIFTWC